MKILAMGCIHGMFDIVNNYIIKLEPDLTILLGDLQTFVEETDMESSSIPQKYWQMGQFNKYTKQSVQFAGPVIAISGNHENAKLLYAFPNGGYLTNNFFYCGRSNIVKFVKNNKEVDIVALSGISHMNNISRSQSYLSYESYINSSYTKKEQVSFYQTSEADLQKILPFTSLLNKSLYLSHDWPLGITSQIPKQKLISKRSNLTDPTIGGPLQQQLFDSISNNDSKYLCAHMHYQIEYTIQTQNTQQSISFVALNKVEYNNYTIFDFDDRHTDQKEGDGVYILNTFKCQHDNDINFNKLQQYYQKIQKSSNYEQNEVTITISNKKHQTMVFNKNAVYFQEKGVQLI